MFSVKTEIVYNHLPKLSGALRRKAAEVVERAALQHVALAKVNAPVDTGALRAEIHAEQESQLAWSSVSSMDYSIYIELGTVKMPPQPYMTPAAEYVRPHFLGEMSHIAEESAGG